MYAQKKLNAISLAFYGLFCLHPIILSAFMVAPLIVSIFSSKLHISYASSASLPINRAQFKNNQISASLPKDSEPLDEESSSIEDDLLKDDMDNAISSETNVHDYIVTYGDTLSNIINQYDVELADIIQLIRCDRRLHNLHIGQKLSWTLNNKHQLQHLTWERSHGEIRCYERTKKGFKVSLSLKMDLFQRKITTVIVNTSFINSARLAGLSTKEIQAVIKSLQWQIDFRKLRDGDRFEILTMYAMLNGKKQKSELLGVRLHNTNKNYYAIRAVNGKFYDRSGSDLTSRFMRFPTVKKYRVSSSFNLRRPNPITGKIIPHKGVDFAVPIGTPVLAIGDGEIIVSRFSSTAGKYVAIRHGHQYMTRYMHLNTLLVKVGQKVKRGEHIALSGNTGRSTGPHVHFEIWVNNQAVNPLTARLPCMEKLTGKNRRNYLDKAKKIILQLNKK
ncbi:murein DD-endopeptidase MepM [Candidatus Erwinia haradaeae]|uniref:Murein DD-endopeptidase MepM n=1 Tax=Candidatus Erwinia haradaeae TaxID=1922217 RepID=A0A451DME7_9GAMM|nr:murein DD-endopeptidase MepM [Candidatus Erwinia haradaeae]VFP87951.1 Murein DD-endopeptidase MepM [Candidatus Erwinia haradaeae]